MEAAAVIVALTGAVTAATAVTGGVTAPVPDPGVVGTAVAAAPQRRGANHQVCYRYLAVFEQDFLENFFCDNVFLQFIFIITITKTFYFHNYISHLFYRIQKPKPIMNTTHKS